MPKIQNTGVACNLAKSRFELEENGHTAFADFVHQDGKLVIPHVEAPAELQGTGAAGRLMEGVVAHAREQGVKIVPTCSYAAAWLKRHPQHGDVVA
jgi:predicted GNAT family acetyltransferase